MGYSFQNGDATVAAGLRRIAGSTAEDAVRMLASDEPLGTRVHEARKAVKMLRGLIRLARPAMADFAAENVALRDIGRGLAPLRDAKIVRRLVDDLAAELQLVAAEKAAIVEALGEAHGPDSPGAVASAIDGFTAVAARSGHWRFEGQGFDLVAGGLVRTYGDALSTLERASRSRDGEAVHDWRRRVKDHWYHARLLRPIWPDMIAPHVAALDRLGELLGLSQDLAVLEERLAGIRDSGALLDLARRRRKHLLDQAGPLGRKLFNDRPKQIAARWRLWWTTTEPPLPQV